MDTVAWVLHCDNINLIRIS